MSDKAIREPKELTDRLIAAGESWADLNAAATALEKSEEVMLARIIVEHFDKPEWKARALAKADERYGKLLTDSVEARQKANKARVRWESGKAYVDLTRSAEASRRAEMNLR